MACEQAGRVLAAALRIRLAANLRAPSSSSAASSSAALHTPFLARPFAAAAAAAAPTAATAAPATAGARAAASTSAAAPSLSSTALAAALAAAPRAKAPAHHQTTHGASSNNSTPFRPHHPISTRPPRPPTGPSMLLRGITFDAVGVLIEPREHVGEAYHRALRQHDPAAAAATTPREIARRYSLAYNAPAQYARSSATRFHDAFWRGIVAAATGSSCPRVYEALYGHFSQPSAWRVLPGAAGALARLRAAGIKTAVLSNNDGRLRPLLEGLGLGGLFDAVVVSAEVGAEKPSPVIFDRALSALSLPRGQVLHVGDDRLLDVWGARGAGLLALLVRKSGGAGAGGDGVRSLPALADRLLRHDDGGSDGVRFYFMHDHVEDEEDDEEEGVH